jgi:ABC-2 type transport system ATP-binding protein
LTSGGDRVLRLAGIRKCYGRMQALKGIDLEIGRAEFVGLLGPNGAGKSTLFRVAAGLFAPDAGVVELFGLDYRHHASAILGRIGVVFQARSLDLDMTLRANLRFHGGLFGLAGGTLAARIAEVAELLDVTPLLDKPVRALSGGNQRRVEIARALLNRPELLLMDEPSVGLDAATRQGLVAHMQRVCRAHGTSILWATHLVDEVEAADRVVVIGGGTIVRTGTPATLIAETGAADLTGAYVALTGKAPA